MGVSLIPTWIVLGHTGCALHVAVQRLAAYQPGPADLQTCNAAFAHHAANVFNMVLELFGSIFCRYEIIQIRRDSHPLRKGARGYEYTHSSKYYPYIRCPQADSNRCLGLERAPSWATRRWGLAIELVLSQRYGKQQMRPAFSERGDFIRRASNRQSKKRAIRPGHGLRWSGSFQYRQSGRDQ